MGLKTSKKFKFGLSTKSFSKSLGDHEDDSWQISDDPLWGFLVSCDFLLISLIDYHFCPVSFLLLNPEH